MTQLIKPKTLQLISETIGNFDTGSNLVKFLKNCGVVPELIKYPQTKWRMLYAVLTTLASSGKPNDHKILFRIIEEASHPLMRGGNERLAKETEKKFNKYLKYDGFQLHDFKIKKTTDKTIGGKPIKTENVKKECVEELAYKLYKEVKKINKLSGEHSCMIILKGAVEYPSSSGEDFVDQICQNTEITLEYFKKEKIIKDYSIKQCGTIEVETIDGEPYTIDGAEIQCKFYPQKIIAYLKNLYEPKKAFVEKLAKLYLKLINIIELYFQKPIIRDEKLNHFYLKISNEINQLLNTNIIPELRVYYKSPGIAFTSDGEAVTEEMKPYKNFISELKTPYCEPFSSLFSAQKEIQGSKTNLRAVINSLNAFYGEIHKFVSLYDIEEKEENEIEEVEKYLSFLKAQKEKQKKEPAPSKIEITGIPELKIRGFEEKIILQKPKNRRIQLRKFPADLKWEEISIQFLNEHEVIIKAKNETLQTTYGAMGFQDEKKKLPNKQWQFLRLLSLKNGEVSWENNQNLPLKQINSIKKQKQLLTEALKSYFQIYDDEPFYNYKKEKAYKIKLNLLPENNTKIIRNEQEIFKEDDGLGIEESYQEQTPGIYEE